MARYVERAESLARLMSVNAMFARDESGLADWRRVLELYADTDVYAERHGEVDAATVTYFYVLDPDHPGSILSSLRQARENARAIRHLISTEMWKHLNMLYNSARERTRRDLRDQRLAELCEDFVHACQTFTGIAEGTFQRSEAWLFADLGRQIERADQTTRVLDMGYDRLRIESGDAVTSAYWNALLRSVAGFHAFRNRHPMDAGPEDIARFLLYGLEFPRAVALCVEETTTRLRALERLHGVRRRKAVETSRREMEFILETGPDLDLTAEMLHDFVDRIQASLGRMSEALHATYFQ